MAKHPRPSGAPTRSFVGSLGPVAGADEPTTRIGSAFPWPQYRTATAADRLVDEGMAVVASTAERGEAPRAEGPLGT